MFLMLNTTSAFSFANLELLCQAVHLMNTLDEEQLQNFVAIDASCRRSNDDDDGLRRSFCTAADAVDLLAPESGTEPKT